MATATETKTQTPTEIPLFTEVEVKAASPFDALTFPERFQKMEDPKYRKDATAKEQQDYDTWLKTVRADKEIVPKEGHVTNVNPELQSYWNGMVWMQEHPDEVKEKQLKLIISSPEVKAMYEDRKVPVWHDTDGATYGINGVQLPAAEAYRYNSKNLGSIAGLNNIDSGKFPFGTAYGKLAGFGEIGGQDVILIDIKDKDGYHVLLPVVVYVEKGPTLPKGSPCIVLNKYYADKHGGSSLFTLPKDEELSPLHEDGKFISWKTLYAGLGKEIWVMGGGYMGELQNETGVVEIHAFSPDLNLEIASIIKIIPK
jgi:hypothetical protein